MVGMIAPGKGEEIEERTEKGADQRTQKGRKQTERADLRNRLLYPIPGFSLGNHPDATGRNAEIGGGGKKTGSCIEKRQQSHAGWSQEHGGKLIPHNTHEHVESLYASQQSGIFQYMRVAVLFSLHLMIGFLCLFHIIKTEFSAVYCRNLQE